MPGIECLAPTVENLGTAAVAYDLGLTPNSLSPHVRKMPIDWSSTVPTDPRGKSFPLKRTPPGGHLTAAVTSEDLIGCDTHFFGGHTMPCERPDCEACGKGMPFRWHGYLSAVNAANSLHFIFEFTAQAADTFCQYRLAHGTLRGCKFRATRLNNKPNGRVILICSPLDQLKIKLPNPPDVAACMSIIWNLPAGQVRTNRKVNGRPAMTHTEQTLARFNPAILEPEFHNT